MDDNNLNVKPKSLKGCLSEYANPALMEQEEGAWERAVAERYGKNEK